MPQPNWFQQCRRKAFYDFHLPDWVVPGEGFDARQFARMHMDAGFQAVCVHAKCHYGNCYYYTRFPNRHPNLLRDIIAEYVAACREAGLRALAYYSTGVDYHAGVDHPEWCTRDLQGATPVYQFRAVCLNSPYVEELLVPQVEELVSEYGVDGLFFDTMSSFGACYCQSCARRFREAHGAELPRERSDPRWPQFAAWRRERADAFVGLVTDRIHELNPECLAGFNQLYTVRDPRPPHPGVDFLVLDPTTSDAHIPEAPFQGRYCAHTGLPYDVMFTRMLYGWADWSPRPAVMMQHDAASLLAQSAGSWPGDRLPPSLMPAPDAMARVAEYNRFLCARDMLVRDASIVCEIAVLISTNTLWGADGGDFGDYYKAMGRAESVMGASRILSERGHHYAILNEQSLLRDLDRYRLVILPEQTVIGAELQDALRAWVRAGGCLLATYRTSAGSEEPGDGTTFALADLLGVELGGVSVEEHGYADLTALCPEYDLQTAMVHGRYTRIRLAGAESLAAWYPPMAGPDPTAPFGWGFAPQSAEASQPAVTLHLFGQGQVAYIPAAIFRGYWAYTNPAVAELVDAVVRLLHPRPLVRVSGAPMVEVSLARGPEGLIAHLVNHHGERMVGRPQYWPLTEYVPELTNITVSVRSDSAPTRVRQEPGDGELPFSLTDGYVTIVLPRLHIHTALVLEGC